MVSETIRDWLDKAMVALGFVRNESARQGRASSRTFTYVMLGAANPYFTDVAQGIEDAAEGGQRAVPTGTVAPTAR
jgi:LacI family transcriptional regulator